VVSPAAPVAARRPQRPLPCRPRSAAAACAGVLAPRLRGRFATGLRGDAAGRAARHATSLKAVEWPGLVSAARSRALATGSSLVHS